MSDLPAQMTRAVAQLAAGAAPATAGPRSLASALWHVAAGIDCSLDGYPQHKPWIFQRTVGRLVLRRFLQAGRMRHDLGAAIPGLAEPEPASLAEASARLHQAWQRFERHRGPCADHFAYGPVTHAQYAQLHAMHLADHLGEQFAGLAGMGR